MKTNSVRRVLMVLVLVVVLGAALFAAVAPAAAQSDEAVVVSIDGQLTRAMLLYLERVFEQASSDGATLIVIEMDTPGGEIDIMNEVVSLIRGSDVPVIVFVTPRGAIAGSAGTVITLAGHLAAMSPETTIGAASPVQGDGSDLPDTISTKVTEVLKAEVRSLAARRGPEAIALAQSTIEDGVAVTVDEALAAGLIDIRAEDLSALLVQADGLTVEMPSGSVTLDTTGLLVRNAPMSFIEQLLGVLANPLLVFTLLAIGFQAILIEVSSPGGGIAGGVGVTFIALALYGLGALSVNWFGLVFIILGIGLLLFETQTPTFGALTAAGVVSLTVGGLVLFNGPGTSEFTRVSIPGVILVSVLSSLFFVFVVYMAVRAQRSRPKTGVESAAGQQAAVTTALDPDGMVKYHGELWRARSESRETIPVGALVEVVSVAGLRLTVRPTSEE